MEQVLEVRFIGQLRRINIVDGDGTMLAAIVVVLECDPPKVPTDYSCSSPFLKDNLLAGCTTGLYYYYI